jgi:hypothetical protein
VDEPSSSTNLYPAAQYNDAPGVRATLHQHIGDAALRFFDANLHVRRERAK